MWEPDVSNAIDNLGMKKIWGSDNFRNYIVDVFVFSRKYVNNKEEGSQRDPAHLFRSSGLLHGPEGGDVR
ncbi:MAG: hypothetical protein MZV63_18270 [Marinilabiliales bacterium]|nr:hypothetical protein [Marinilabiliales bacterium]